MVNYDEIWTNLDATKAILYQSFIVVFSQCVCLYLKVVNMYRHMVGNPTFDRQNTQSPLSVTGLVFGTWPVSCLNIIKYRYIEFS